MTIKSRSFVQDDKTACHPEQRKGSVFDSRKTNTGFFLTLRMTIKSRPFVQDDKTICHPEQREGSVFDSRKTNTAFFADDQNDRDPKPGPPLHSGRQEPSS